MMQLVIGGRRFLETARFRMSRNVLRDFSKLVDLRARRPAAAQRRGQALEPFADLQRLDQRFGTQFGDDDVFLGLKVSQLVSIVVLAGLIPVAYLLRTTEAPDYEVPERLVRPPSRAQRRRQERRAATRKTQ